MTTPAGPHDPDQPAWDRAPGSEAAGQPVADEPSWERRGWAGEPETERPEPGSAGRGTLVYPGWGQAQPMGFASPALSRASTVQVLGIFSLVTLPVCGVGLVLAVIALAMARSVRREMAAAGGRGPGGREVKVGVVCALITVVLGGLFLVGWILVIALALGSSVGG